MKTKFLLFVCAVLLASCSKQETAPEPVTKQVNPDKSVTYVMNSADASRSYQWEVNGIPVGSDSKILTLTGLTKEDRVTCKTAVVNREVNDEQKSAAASLLINGDGVGTTDWDDNNATDNGLADDWFSNHRMRWNIISMNGDKAQKVMGQSVHPYMTITDRPDVGENKFKLKSGDKYSISFVYTSTPDSIRIAYTEFVFPPCNRPTRVSCTFTYHGPDNASILFYSISIKPGNCNDWFTLDKMNLYKGK